MKGEGEKQCRETRHAQQDSETRERSGGSMCESAKIMVTEEVKASCRLQPTPGRASHSHVLSSEMPLPRTVCAGSVMKIALPLSRDGIMFQEGSDSTPTARERTIPSHRHMSFPGIAAPLSSLLKTDSQLSLC